MTTVLRLNTSILGPHSVSTTLTEEFLAGLQQRHDEPLSIIERDFADSPVPHLDSAWLQALSTPEETRSVAQQEMVAYSDTLIKEIQAAQYLVIGLPMYNFAPPSMLKAWVDHVARAGVTFRYTDKGAEGLLRNKTAYLLASMGGRHEAGVSDFLRPYMQLVLGFLGITDIHIATASGLAMGETQREQALTEARTEITNWLESIHDTEEQVA